MRRYHALPPKAYRLIIIQVLRPTGSLLVFYVPQRVTCVKLWPYKYYQGPYIILSSYASISMFVPNRVISGMLSFLDYGQGGLRLNKLFS